MKNPQQSTNYTWPHQNKAQALLSTTLFQANASTHLWKMQLTSTGPHHGSKTALYNWIASVMIFLTIDDDVKAVRVRVTQHRHHQVCRERPSVSQQQTTQAHTIGITAQLKCMHTPSMLKALTCTSPQMYQITLFLD